MKSYLLIIYRLFFGLLALSSIVLEVVTLVDRESFNGGNLFSYFTILSNLFAGLVLLATIPAIRRGSESYKLEMFRGAATLYMLTTGLVFTFLLSGIKDASFTAVPWDNFVLHYLMPVVVCLDWLFDSGRFKISFTAALSWLSFPLVYVCYSLFRGQVTGWYPYPFLDPTENGYGKVLGVSFGLAVLLLLLIWLLTLSTKYQKSYRQLWLHE